MSDSDRWNTLKRGSKGPDVEAWQSVLIRDGYSLAPFGADGDFGGMTERETQKWQFERGLNPDGVVGPQTRAAIVSHCITEPSPPPGGLMGMFSRSGLTFADVSVDPRPNQPFRPVGIIIHHTAAGGSENTPSLDTIRHGRPDLHGPLAPILIGRIGGIYVICNEGGVCNHAGMGRSVVLERVRQGEPLQQDDVSWSVRDSVGGNSWFYGVELENAGDGIEPFGRAQYSAAVSVCSSILENHGWGPNSVIAHHEWTRRKIDPNRSTFNIDAFRGEL